MLILGVDHGSKSTGFGYIEVDTNTKEMSYVTHGYNKILFNYPESLKIQSDFIRKQISDRRPDVIAFEGPKDKRGFHATQVMTEILGAIKTVAVDMGVPFVEIPPTTLKKIVAGNGFATKLEVAISISEVFNIPLENLVGSIYYLRGIKKGQLKDYILDGTDALGLAIAAVTYIPRVGKLDYEGA